MLNLVYLNKNLHFMIVLALPACLLLVKQKSQALSGLGVQVFDAMVRGSEPEQH
jgi:hypothetical protein